MPTPAPPHPEAANKLAVALIESSHAPLLLLDGDCHVMLASRSFCENYQCDTQDIVGRPLAALGAGEWAIPGLDALLRATASDGVRVRGYEMDLTREGVTPRQLVLNAQRLNYGDAGGVRLLVAVADVTEARIAEKIKDDLLREKGILLQELQHRVANSLQIIASMLMQSARRVDSEETRHHLRDAHNRVLSIAAVQRHLAASRIGEVALRPYFEGLCRSIRASMIRDHDEISLDVDVDESSVVADVSVSLGLIVTELVINALKHAFPDQRTGAIRVDYHTAGPDWTLSVIDDGIGMPGSPDAVKAGLGTTIVAALAKQLHARVEISDTKPGTTVSIVHD